MSKTDVRQYLKTLRRIPREVRQSMATREMHMLTGATCVCGWAVRDDILRSTGEDAEWSEASWIGRCLDLFGGKIEEWAAIYWGVAESDRVAEVEEAFAIAVSETVRA